jgi:type IX secretion system PorP/SprF family membrane protein
MKQLVLITLIILTIPASVFSQKKMIVSQYMHNRYAINPAFAGSREVLSLHGSYRKQWVSAPNSPEAQFFTAHAPLKNDNIALGLTLFNEKYAIAKNTGFALAYAYRINAGNQTKLAFSINAGMVSSKTQWDDVTRETPDDPAFGENETVVDPQVGFGVAWYGNNFFSGFSISDLFYKNAVDPESPFFEPSKSDYVLTGGYLFKATSAIKLQPSVLVRFNPDEFTLIDYSATAIIQNLIWTGLTYRSNKELIAMVGWQVTPQLRFAYSFDYPTGDLANMSSGNHEVSIQFDFGYKVRTISPKFF